MQSLLSRPPAHLTAALIESYGVAPKLRIDEDAGIIFGVKICGRYSKNCHGIPGVTKGTEYTVPAMRGACSIYEGRKSYLKHSTSARPADRGPFDYFAVIRSVRFDEASQCPRGDLHYRKTHEDTPKLLEDIRRGLGGFGLSHHIPPGGYRGRVVDGRLVVEAITDVKSVDLVSDPATTTNLWESRERPQVLTGEEFRQRIMQPDRQPLTIMGISRPVVPPVPRSRPAVMPGKVPTGAAFRQSIQG